MSDDSTGAVPDVWLPCMLGQLLQEAEEVTADRLEMYGKHTLLPVAEGEEVIAEAPKELVRILALAWEKSLAVQTEQRKARGAVAEGDKETAHKHLDEADRLQAHIKLLSNVFWDDIAIQCALWKYEDCKSIWIRQGYLIALSREKIGKVVPEATKPPSAPSRTLH